MDGEKGDTERNPPTSSERRACEVHHSIPPSTIHLPPIPAILPFEDSRKPAGIQDSRTAGFEARQPGSLQDCRIPGF